ncbi:hypothetical protein VTG60DRAFT_4159 [Thermothelomyces hinnuleus]
MVGQEGQEPSVPLISTQVPTSPLSIFLFRPDPPSNTSTVATGWLRIPNRQTARRSQAPLRILLQQVTTTKSAPRATAARRQRHPKTHHPVVLGYVPQPEVTVVQSYQCEKIGRDYDCNFLLSNGPGSRRMVSTYEGVVIAITRSSGKGLALV